MAIAHRPATVFVNLFRQAQAAIDAIVESYDTFHDSCMKCLDSRESQQ
jgi:hypothetical protein